jgi:hypothetical protein
VHLMIHRELKMKGSACAVVISAVTLTCVYFCSHRAMGEVDRNVPPDELEVIIKAHRQTRELIQAIEAVYNCESINYLHSPTGDKTTGAYKWWQLGAHYKFSQLENEPYKQKKNELLAEVESGERTQLKSTQLGVNKKVGIKELAKGGEKSFADLWTRAGFVLQQSPYLTIADAIADTANIKSARYVRNADDEEDPEITYGSPSGFIAKVLLSHRHGYLVSRIRKWQGPMNDSVTRTQFTVQLFKEHEPGVFFPQKAHQLVMFGDATDSKPSYDISVEFLKVAINKDIRKADLHVAIPNNTPTIDKVKNISYVMGPDGKPSPNRKINDLLPPVQGQNADLAEIAIFDQWRVILWILVILCPGVFFAVIWVRRRRA